LVERGKEEDRVSEEQRLQVVDAHVHLWDLGSNLAWYPALAGSEEFESLGDVKRMARDYLVPELRDDTAPIELAGVVHVSAVSAPRVQVEEARWVEAVLDELGVPSVTMAALEANSSRAELEADLDAQGGPRLRGARVLSGLEPDAPAATDVCSALGERDLVFDLVAHPADIPAFVKLLEGFPGLTVVLEHAGWPEGTGEEERGAWRRALEGLAELPNVSCKISGLGMATHSLSLESQRPWIEGCLAAFGPQRCIFGGNFPVDAMYGTYEELIGTVAAATEGLDETGRCGVFVENARRVYGL
jgi:predicted TIM-barrel fold metal-dependent hydrolase